MLLLIELYIYRLFIHRIEGTRELNSHFYEHPNQIKKILFFSNQLTPQKKNKKAVIRWLHFI